MASLTVDGLNEFVLSMDKLAQLPDNVVSKMLTDGGTIIMNAQKAGAPRRTGKLANSIKLGKMKRTYDSAAIEIKPEGTHHTPKTGKPVRNAEVAFILEYGAPSRNIAPRQWMHKANESAADSAVNAEEKAYNDYLNSLGL